MKKDQRGINTASKPSGDGCVDVWQQGGLHLCRCTECGHIGCCDSSPSQHASKRAKTKGHSVVTSFASGEDWFFDYEINRMFKGAELTPTHTHPASQPVSGPAGKVPSNWESRLN